MHSDTIMHLSRLNLSVLKVLSKTEVQHRFAWRQRVGCLVERTIIGMVPSMKITSNRSGLVLIIDNASLPLLTTQNRMDRMVSK